MRGRLGRGEALKPVVVVLGQPGLRVVDVDGGRDVHRVDEGTTAAAGAAIVTDSAQPRRTRVRVLRLPSTSPGWEGVWDGTVPAGPALHALSFSRTRSLTTFGFAFPPVSFITCPTKNPSRPSLPPRYASTCCWFSPRIRSITGSSSLTSAIAASAR